MLLAWNSLKNCNEKRSVKRENGNLYSVLIAIAIVGNSSLVDVTD